MYSLLHIPFMLIEPELSSFWIHGDLERNTNKLRVLTGGRIELTSHVGVEGNSSLNTNLERLSTVYFCRQQSTEELNSVNNYK